MVYRLHCQWLWTVVYILLPHADPLKIHKLWICHFIINSLKQLYVESSKVAAVASSLPSWLQHSPQWRAPASLKWQRLPPAFLHGCNTRLSGARPPLSCKGLLTRRSEMAVEVGGIWPQASVQRGRRERERRPLRHQSGKLGSEGVVVGLKCPLPVR